MAAAKETFFKRAKDGAVNAWTDAKYRAHSGWTKTKVKADAFWTGTKFRVNQATDFAWNGFEGKMKYATITAGVLAVVGLILVIKQKLQEQEEQEELA